LLRNLGAEKVAENSIRAHKERVAREEARILDDCSRDLDERLEFVHKQLSS
jgi:hypothetical protein